MKLAKYISFFLLLFTVSIASAQVQFEAKISKQKLGENERLRIDFQMNKDGDNFTPPDFANFTVVGGPNTSVSNSYAYGKRTFSKTYSYFLSPEKRGKITIKSASIEIEGQTYNTKPIEVLITKPVKPSDALSRMQEAATENIHLVAEVSKTSPYLNEAITVVYKLYVSPNTRVSNWKEVGKPEYNDFWSQNIEIKGLKIENGKFKGEDYRYVVLRKTVLYPQKTGTLKLEPLSLDVTVDVPTNRRDIFGGRIMKPVHKTIAAGSRSLKVKALPEQGKPDNFTGAVGEFDFNIATSKKELDANESLQLKVEVSGKGNLRLFNLPEVKLASSLEVYEPEHDEKVRVNLAGMQGQVSDSYTIVPQFKGKYPIPSISFSYFDLKTETYKQIQSQEQSINVINGPVNSTTSDENIAAANGKQKVVLSNDQFAFIKTQTKFIPKKKDYFFKSKLFWSSLVLPLIAIPLAVVFRRKKEERDADFVGNRIRKADKLAKKYLTEAKRTLGKKEAFYIALEKALHNYLKGKLNIETSDLSKDKIKVLLQQKQVQIEVVDAFNSILENCELARYTPITQVTMQQDYDKAAQTINQIDKQIR